MRVVALVLTTIGFTVLTTLGLLGILLLSETDDPLWSTVSSAGVGLALCGPLILGSLASWWRLRGGSDSGRHYRRSRNIAASSTALGAALVLTGGLLTGVPVWLLVVIVVVAFALLLAVPVGDRLRRAADARGPRETDAFTTDATADTRAATRRAVLVFTVTLVLAAAAWVAVGSAWDAPFDPQLGLMALALTFLATSTSYLASTIRLNRRAREIAGHDFGRLRMITRVVLQGKSEELDEPSRIAAAQYATFAPTLLGTQLAQSTLLFTGLALNIAAQALGRSVSSALPIALLGAIGLMIAIFVPLQLRYIRRARAYAGEHRHLLSTS